jgi:lambda family phage portal protein
MANLAATLIDRFVGYINPNAGLRRLRAREMLTRAYEGASQKDGWRPRRSGASANADHLADGASLRARARALVQNVPYISRGLESLVSNTIGTGITPRSLSSNATAVDKLWSEWAKVCDADGKQDIYGLQANAYRAMEQDGEVLIRLRARRPEDGLPVPLQLQVLEIDWLDSSRMGSNGSNTILNGIEYDPLGKIVFYWLWDQHPGELVPGRRGKSTSYPVPAERIIHLFVPQRPGQGRGFTRLAPVIARVRDVQLYEDAELQRKNLETRLSVLASGDVTAMSMTESEAQTTVRSTGELGTLASGGITQVPTGTNLTVVEPKAAGGYVDYVKYQLHLIASGMGVTYEMMTGDVREVNFSSARVSMLEFRRNAEQMQWLTLIPRLCEPIWRAFVDAASMAGFMKAKDYGVDWSTPKWSYVDPEKEVKAELAAVSGGFSSISEVLRRQGYKPELVFAEIKRDFDRLRADGTLEIMLQLQTNQAPQAPAAADAARAINDVAITTARQFDATSQAMESLRAETRAQNTLITAMLANREQPTPVTNVINQVQPTPVEFRNEITTPAPEVTVNNHVAPTPVEIRNEFTANAPEVNITNQVQPAAVSVDLKTSLPARVSETVIERDAAKNIVRSTTTERDA